MSETENIEEVNKAEVENASNPKQNQKSEPSKQKPEEKTEDEIVEDEEDEAQKLMNSLVSISKKFLKLCVSAVKFIFGLIKSLVGCIRSLIGAGFGFGIFALFAYILSTFFLHEVQESDIPDFEAKLKFLLRNEIWPVFPVFLAGAVGTLRKNEVHMKFARDRFEQAFLFLFNLLLLSTHIDIECLTCIRACALLHCAFSLVQWFCICNTKKSGCLFGRAVTHLNYLLMGYNIYVLLGEDLGLGDFSGPSVASVQIQTETSSGWF